MLNATQAAGFTCLAHAGLAKSRLPTGVADTFIGSELQALDLDSSGAVAWVKSLLRKRS